MAIAAAAYDVVVVGAGVIGCAVARALSDARLSVAVVDSESPGQGASGAAAGLLAPQFEDADGPGPLFNLCHRSRALYPDFAAALREETGLDVELRRDGLLVLALSEEDEAELDRLAAWQREARLPVERIESGRLRELESLAAPDARWALFLPQDIQVDNVRLCGALARSLEKRRVARITGRPVSGIEIAGDRLVGVVLASGDRIGAERVVLAAGAWSGGIAGLPRPLPVMPVRGQMIELRDPPGPMRRILASREGTYIVPRLDGRLLAGSTMEEAGFASHPTAGGIGEILSRTLRIAPALRSARLARVWAGLRPGTPDDLPILGPDADVPALIYATGHFRNGILLAPITAQIIAELITGAKPGIGLTEFRLERFG